MIFAAYLLHPLYGKGYQFWSGIGSDIGEITLIGLVLNWYRIHKCVKCWRLSHHDVAGTHYATCHNHFTEEDHLALQSKHKQLFPKQHAFGKIKKIEEIKK